MPQLFNLARGTSPLLINVPHAGTHIPPELYESMTPTADTMPDTDWYVDLLYEFALDMGAGLMAATHSRYVIDLNRDPGGAALYEGLINTELCPLHTFANDDVYLPDCAPDQREISSRITQYWRPYHLQLETELNAIKAQHGYAILLEGHSILSEVPRLFNGRLPDLNLGTADGKSCDKDLETTAFNVLQTSPPLTFVLNGRFKGGYITRHYGNPAQKIHALQLEMAQATYMDELAPFYTWSPTLAQPLIGVLKRFVETLIHWRLSQ